MVRFRARLLLGVGVVVAALASVSSVRADALQVVPTRALGMGGALRGLAAGSSALTLNPSGISIVRSYVLEGAYQYLDAEGGHIAHVAIADSTSASNVGGGLTYTYATASPSGLVEGAEGFSRHEFGLSLSFPFGERLAIGATGRYLRLEHQLPGGIKASSNGVTFDAGITLRPVDKLSLGVVGYGLRDLKDPQAPSGFGGGIALVPIPDLVLAADVVVDRRTYAPVPDEAVTYSGGAEYTWAGRVGFRAGGGRDGVRKTSFGTIGLTALSESGALDIGGRLDLSGPNKAYLVTASLRLFVPTP